MQDSKLLVLRADASPQTGAGHVMRCVALGEAWRRQGGEVEFVGRIGIPWVRERLQAEGFRVKELVGDIPQQESPYELLQHVGNKAAAWVVLDGYHFGSDCQRALKDVGKKLLVIDDYNHHLEYCCDVLLNQNISSEKLEYCGDIGIKFLGPKYALIREEFFEIARKRREQELSNEVVNILVSLGGGSMSHALPLLRDTLQQLELTDCTVRIVQGNISAEEWKQATKDVSGTIELISQCNNMPELLEWSDFCISAAGSTCWELCALQVPFSVLSIARNQEEICDNLIQQNVALPFETKAIQTILDNKQLRVEMTKTEGALVDTYGADRIAKVMSSNELTVQIVSDKESWLRVYFPDLIKQITSLGHTVKLHDSIDDVYDGDITFFLGCFQIASPKVLRRSSFNLVVHESALPAGRGWSPLSWQIIEGKQSITVSLFEAADDVDSGPIYLQTEIQFDGTELVDELREKQAAATIQLCAEFIENFPLSAMCAKKQSGDPTYYPRRGPEDSLLDFNKTIEENFNLLRTVDNKRYPAFFYCKGEKYYLQITKKDLGTGNDSK